MQGDLKRELPYMARRRSSLGFLGFFGRSHDLRQFDEALRSVDLHPRMVPEPIKLTVVNLLKDHAVGPEPAPQSYRAAAELICYCMIGAEAFAGANNPELALQIDRRILAALEIGDSLDAQLILLTLHAGVAQPSIIDHYHLHTAPD